MANDLTTNLNNPAERRKQVRLRVRTDRLLTWMYRYLSWIFTTWFFVLSVGLMLAAAFHVALHFNTFQAKLPAYHEFFTWNSVLYMWISLGVVKIIHEFGHGLSCKAF